jgi:hypothetical protein
LGQAGQFLYDPWLIAVAVTRAFIEKNSSVNGPDKLRVHEYSNIL